jgi:hypothetical protein
VDRKVRKKVIFILTCTLLAILGSSFVCRLKKTIIQTNNPSEAGQILEQSLPSDITVPEPSSITQGRCLMIATNVSMRVNRKDCKNGFQTITHAIRQDNVGWYKPDVWQNDFFVSCSDPDEIIVISNGPDQVPNTPDDVVCSMPWSFKLLTWMQFLRFMGNGTICRRVFSKRRGN